MSRPTFPFTALHGQETLCTALLLVAIDPLLGGVLIEGPRGTAKSTAARALADLLPQGQSRFVNLPLGASEEQLIGTLDLEDALQRGEANFKPGLLARAHGGVLYVDEINLLADALVDALLDVSASGINTIERDGISHQHDARIVLIGTMNPEEGELRPQLLDRFGLFVRADQLTKPETRREIARARLAFDADPAAFQHRYQPQQQQLSAQLARARALLPQIPFPDAIHELVSTLCHAAATEGVRADLAMLRAARAHAALHGRTQISAEDVYSVAELALAHRRREGSDANDAGGTPALPGTPDKPDWGALPPEQTPPIHPVKSLKDIEAQRAVPSQSRSADAGQTQTPGKAPLARLFRRGERDTPRIHWPRTLLQKANQPLTREHLRFQRRAAAGSVLHCLVLDCSASMLCSNALSLAKGLLLRLANRLYHQRAELAVIAFNGQGAKLVQPPGKAIAFNENWIRPLAGSGGTPILSGLRLAEKILQTIRRRTPDKHLGLWLLTDGRFPGTPPRPEPADFRVVVDFEAAALPLGRAGHIASAWQASLLSAKELTAA
jgi:Mg-chelatase subunit ChlI